MLEFPWDSPGIFETGKWNKKNRDEAKKIAVYSNYNYQPIHGKMRRFITEISKQFQAESNEGPQQQQEKISGQQKNPPMKMSTDLFALRNVHTHLIS